MLLKALVKIVKDFGHFLRFVKVSNALAAKAFSEDSWFLCNYLLKQTRQ